MWKSLASVALCALILWMANTDTLGMFVIAGAGICLELLSYMEGYYKGYDSAAEELVKIKRSMNESK